MTNADLRAAYNIHNGWRDRVRRKIKHERAPKRIFGIVLREIEVVLAVGDGRVALGAIWESAAHDNHLGAVDDVAG